MRMRKRILWFSAPVILGLLALIVLAPRRSRVSPHGVAVSPDGLSAESHPVESGFSALTPGQTIVEGGAGANPAAPASPKAGAAVAATGSSQGQPLVEAVFDALHEYRMRFKENPVGSNAEITAALTGANADDANLVSNPGLKQNAAQELVDEWGTPFFLHQLSGTEMEIRSAGPDRRMWTADDRKYP